MAEPPLEQAESQPEHWRESLARGPWFAGLPADLKPQILDRVVVRNYASGEIICRQGDSPQGLYGIISGVLHSVGTARDGEEALLSVLRAGEWTGFIGMVDGQANSFATKASTAAQIAFLPKAAFGELFLGRVERLKLVVRPLIEIIRFSYRFLIEVNGRSPARVVAQRLMDLSHCVYLPDTPPAADLLSVNQEDVAAATYLTRPTVNRILQNMAKQGVVRLGYGSIEINDIPALNEIATEPSARAKPTLKAPDRRRGVSSPAKRDLSPERLREILMLGRWFAWLPQDIREEIIPRLIVRRLEKGEYLYTQGQQSEGMFVALSGQLKTFGVAADGRRTLFTLLHPGDWTGFAPPFDERPDPLSSTATRPSQVALLPSQAVAEIFEANPARYARLYTPPMLTARQIYDFLVNTNGKNPACLVARRLYDLALTPYQYGEAPREFLDNLSQTDIAEATSLSRPSVNKVLGDLSARAIVEVGYGRIKIIDPAALLAIAQGEIG